MGKPLKGMSSGSEARMPSHRALRRRLALTTILAVSPFLGYGRQAYAACDPSPGPPTFVCSGTETTQQTVNADNADVSAAPGFSVNTGDASGVFITGNGHLRFTDENSPPTVISAATTGLRVISSNVVPMPGGVTIATNGTITGGTTGIFADNSSGGHLTITANGDVTGTNGEGIQARNYGENLAITTGPGSNITGGNYGIFARNYGTGTFELTVNGEVTGEDADGIYARNDGTDMTVTTGVESTITGDDEGMVASNTGSGHLDITVDGDVTGNDGDGMQAENSSDGTYLKITAGAQSVISGQENGIDARNSGNGNLEITANGEVSGEDEHGIYALNDENGIDLSITTGSGSKTTGGTDGIVARNLGEGLLEVDANGEVTGAAGDGIMAFALDGDVEVRTGANSTVTGVDGDGIGAFASNSGNVVVRTRGAVTGSIQGIDAEAVGDGGTVLVETFGTVTGGSEGIEASANSNVTVRTRGDVTGRAGISAYAGSGNILITTAADTLVAGSNTTGVNATITSTGNIVIDVRSAVTGAYRGIDTYAYDGTIDITTGAGAIRGTGENGIEATASDNVRIKVGGDVRGGVAGITATSDLGAVAGAIQIINNGTVANLSGEGDDRAITTSGGATTIDNNANLIGTVFTGAAGDTLNNAGRWFIAGGINDFGGAFDGDVINNSGVIIAADNAAVAALTIIDNLEFFNNAGVVSLVDGGELDTLNLAALPGDISYVGQGGRLAVDGFLAAGAAGRSDLLHIAGNTSGVTYVSVNLTNPIGSAPNFDGIPVVEVDGATAQGDFDAEGGVINAGFFAWDVRLDEDGQTHELYTTGLGDGAYEFAAGVTALQDLWHQTNGTILQRQADLRPLLEGVGVTPVADYSEPVAPTAVAKLTPGFWFRGVGAYSERDDENNGITLDRKQATYGGLAGFDFGTQDVGDALMFGVFGGYIFSDVDFDRTNTEWNMEGPTVGVYATYLDHALHLDATVKADFLDIDIDADDIAPGAGKADTDAFNIGGQVDAGYKIGLAHGLFVDPQASLAVVHTEIDDIDDILGGAVEFDDGTSVRGRLGLRLGHETTASDGTIYSGDVTASVWQEFAGDNDATVFAPLTPATNVSDDPAETYGDVSVGFNVLAPEGWSGFLRANYLFAEDYDAIAGNAGVRFAW